ncbi:heme peroxidase [Thozetella sp. PMI_491]|nr:heme peroxidase [Thozetella sp. PMI_491]
MQFQLARLAQSGAILAALSSPAACYTWPDERIDKLEAVLYQQNGFRQNGLAFGVTPCNSMENMQETGRDDAAEWFRTAYHDMATADVVAGTGGIDASIAFETDREENVGKAFNESVGFFQAFQTTRSSMADLIALGAQMAVASCSNGTILIPYRGGRVDVAGPGPSGVPTPDQGLDSHMAAFARQGFNVTEMIGLVACGHTLGGVHGENFPQIVPVPNPVDPNNQASRQDFDETFDVFDNSVAKQFVANTSQNPLAFGHNETMRSDFRIFNADGGDLIRRMAESQEFFAETCNTLLERMLNTVPADVTLTDIITPIAVKPGYLNVAVNENSTMNVSGEIRLLDDGSTPTDRSVTVHLLSRTGEPVSAGSVAAYTLQGLEVTGLYPGMPSFTTYLFNATVTTAEGVSFFSVSIDEGSNTTVADNEGLGFPFPDVLVPQASGTCTRLAFVGPLSKYSNNTLEITVAARDDFKFDSVQLEVPTPINIPGSLLTRYELSTVNLTRTQKVGGSGYSLYQGAFSYQVLSVGPQKTFNLVASGASGQVRNDFFSWSEYPFCRT